MTSRYEHLDGPTSASRRRLCITCAVWAVTALASLSLVTKALRTHGYLFDLSANFAAHAAWASALVCVIALVFRRWLPAAILAAICATHIAWLSVGRAPASSDPSATPITVVQFNALTLNRTPEAVLELLERTEADLIGVVEIPDATIEMIRTSTALRAKFPYQAVPEFLDEQNKVRLSKYPFEVLDLVDETNPNEKWQYVLGHTAIVDHPAGRFVHALLLPISPRSPGDWVEGTATMATELRYLADRVGPKNLPWILGIDMNATPGTERADIARRLAGLVRAKPLTVFSGTWPSWAPGPMRVAIDDLLVSEGVRVRSWEVLNDSAGSDHVPVRAVLTLEGKPGQ